MYYIFIKCPISDTVSENMQDNIIRHKIKTYKVNES